MFTKNIVRQNNINRQNECLQYTKEYINSNPIKSISGILFSIGFFIIILYFYKVEFYPITKISDFPSLFIIFGSIGLFFIFSILGAMVIPARMFASNRNEAFSLITFHHNEKIDRKLKQITYILPLFLFLITCWLFIELYISKLAPYFLEFYNFLIICFSTLVFVIYVIYFYNKFKNEIKQKKVIFLYIFSLVTSLFMISFTSFLILFAIISNNDNLNTQPSILFIFIIVYILLFNYINVIKIKGFDRFIFNLFLLAAMFIHTSTSHVISFTIVKKFGLGQVEVDMISIKEKDYCIKLNEICIDNKIIDSKLIWRLGNELVIEKDLKNNLTKRYHINSKMIDFLVFKVLDK